MSSKMKSKLPDKPSALLLLALQDIDAMEKAGHTIDMGEWVYKDLDGKCSVCLAGAVMLNRFPEVEKTLETISGSFVPSDFPGSISLKLHALDAFRRGSLAYAFEYLNMKLPESLPEKICGAEDGYLPVMSKHNRPGWINHMLDLVGILQAEGL